ncbi:MAG: twin-arginine translocase TatA/TatE family subunit [Chloroflexota bacterium]
MRLGPLEFGVILLVVLVIFGPGKLPQVGGALGRAVRLFNHSRSGEEEKPDTGNKREA